MMNKVIIGTIAGVGLFLSVLVASVFAQTATPLPKPTGFVSDYANVLTQDEINTLDQKLSAYQKKTTNEIAVVTVNTTGDQTIEEYATAIGDQWKPGVKGKDNGIILVIAIKDHHDRIEVGRGLQGNLTDIQANGILDDMVPQLRSSDYNGALTTGVNEVISTIGNTDGSNGTIASSKGSSDSGLFWVGLLVVVIIIIVVVFFALKNDTEGGDDSSDSSDSDSGNGIMDTILGAGAGYAAGKASSRDNSDDYSSSRSSDDDDNSSSGSGFSFGSGSDSFGGGFSGGSFDGGGSSGSW